MINPKIKFYLVIPLFFFQFKGYTDKIKLGLNTGFNFSTIVNSNTSDQFNNGRGFLPGLAFGMNTEYLIRDDYSLLFEINYSTKGFTINQTGVRVKSYYKYFEIPFRLKYYSSKQFAIEVGPYIGIAFREYLNKISPDVDMTSTYIDSDGIEKEFTVPMTVTFLWPAAGV